MARRHRLQNLSARSNIHRIRESTREMGRSRAHVYVCIRVYMPKRVCTGARVRTGGAVAKGKPRTIMLRNCARRSYVSRK